MTQEHQDLHAGPGVQVAGGLIGEDDGRSPDQGPSTGDALLLSSGELVGTVGQAVLDPEGVHHGVEPREIQLGARDVDGQGDVLAGVSVDTRL